MEASVERLHASGWLTEGRTSDCRPSVAGEGGGWGKDPDEERSVPEPKGSIGKEEGSGSVHRAHARVEKKGLGFF